ncbi:sigma factor [Nesterenkonia sp. AN1]|uniref:RNA polymerase sigma-70 factor (ECF subfamily) n=1 Tax=Nesterenkonia aurantiaca TaxID=1436010 RepID=A0A4R7FZ84_9MICC|nr:MULTISPECIES: sigma-70 family RNA polymerase sigma factor [Nesterenkonia]EXF25829.1 sigma factor [Nesterenkonia sp. AN1]TDS84214.1 RNA polymerase sigma-70 factor (ECF subfamily) [Nesterenkonia aurantiaca]
MSISPLATPPAFNPKRAPILSQIIGRPAGALGTKTSHVAAPPKQAAEDAPFDVREAYAAHGAALFAFAFNGLGDRTDAEDCVQEAFIRAWKGRERYSSSRGSVRTWLFAIERNLIIDALRSRSRRPSPSGEQKIESASEPVTEDLLIVERLAIYEALAGLSVEHREVIVAVKLDGMDYQELSERTGIPIATLRTRMYYGLRSLRKTLGDGARDGAETTALQSLR